MKDTIKKLLKETMKIEETIESAKNDYIMPTLEGINEIISDGVGHISEEEMIATKEFQVRLNAVKEMYESGDAAQMYEDTLIQELDNSDITETDLRNWLKFTKTQQKMNELIDRVEDTLEEYSVMKNSGSTNQH